MCELGRITTEYVDTEDRLRLVGETLDGVQLVLWLTRRLTVRLIPHVLLWLEQQAASVNLAHVPSEHAEALHDFAQQAAWAASPPRTVVRTTQATECWLVHSIDLTPVSEMLVLCFKGAEPEAQARFSVTAQLLRQWLSVLHGQCVKGDWPMIVWHAWLEAGAPGGSANSPITMH